MYGLIGRMIARPGKRDDLVAIMQAITTRMPGCLSYVVATDPTHDDAIWITEVWVDEASHKASLALPQVQEAIEKARPLITGLDSRTVTAPVALVGLGDRD